jgi:transcription termination factor Rho
MNERRRPHRRGRGPRPFNREHADSPDEPNPYLDQPDISAGVDVDTAPVTRPSGESGDRRDADNGDSGDVGGGNSGNATERIQESNQHHVQESVIEGADESPPGPPPASPTYSQAPQGVTGGSPGPQQQGGFPRQPNPAHSNGRHQHGRRRNRGRGQRREHQAQHPQQAAGPPVPIVVDGDTAGWFDPSRDGGFVRRGGASYLADAGDAYVPPQVMRQYGLRRGDSLVATTGRDHRGRITVVDISQINEGDPALAARRPDFSSLTASYPERKLTLETGRPAKVGPELTRRAIDLIAPIGYGQRALIVAPARAGKTMLLQAITEGVAVNHPNATLFVLLVDERPEEVSEMITWGYGEVVASSFDMPAERHTDVAEMVLERARRLVEIGKDVVIVLDSITRLARAHNTVERGTGRTLSGGLDATAMAKPKAFFGSARSVAPNAGGGSLTIIATALVETGSRMDDVIFEEFKGTGNCEIKLDRSLAEKRIYPAIDIATSGTRREDKLFRPDQLDSVFTLRRGLQQMPPQSSMEWLIKRIAATPNNDALLAGL